MKQTKKIVQTLALDNMNPGDKMNISFQELAKLGLGAEALGEGGHLAGKLAMQGQITIERDKNDPNKFIFTSGADLLVGVEAEGDIGVPGASASGEIGAGSTLSLEMDFSKKGEATNTALFFARSSLPFLDGADQLSENFAGKDIIPGDSTGKFIGDHFKSADIHMGTSKEFGITIGEYLNLPATIKNNMTGNFKLERNKNEKGDTTSWDLTSSIDVSGGFNINNFEGEDLIGVKTKLLEGQVTGSLENKITLDMTGDEEKLTSEMSVKFNLEGQLKTEANLLKTKGINLEVSGSISNIMENLSEKDKAQLQEALTSKDYESVYKICHNALDNPSIQFQSKINTFETTYLEVGVGGEAYAPAGGGGGQISGGYEYISPISSYEGSFSMNDDGVEIKGSNYEYGTTQEGSEGTFKISWSQILPQLEENRPEDSQFIA